MVFSTIISGLAGTGSVLPLSGFTDAPLDTINPVGSIDLTTQPGLAAYAQPFSGDRTITAIYAHLTLDAAITLTGSVTPTAQLWTADDDTAEALPGVVCQFPPLAGTVPVGETLECAATGLSEPVMAGTRASSCSVRPRPTA